MSLWQLLAVAAVQGLTEYLPVSSSAHLILLPGLLGVADQGLRVDVAAHLGTFVAVIVYFRADLLRLTRSVLASEAPAGADSSADRRLAWWLLLASVPALVVGWLVRDDVATVARSARVVALASIVFGLVLWVADRYGVGRRAATDLGWRGAVAVGVAQALALIPGASRSGTTISAGLLVGLSREEATRFSFLLSIPVSLGVAMAEGLDLWRRPPAPGEIGELFAVFLLSGILGYACIHFFLVFIQRHRLTPFVLYRLLLGLALWLAVVPEPL